MQIFRQFDKNGDGFIDVEEMSSEAMSLLSRSLSDSDVIEMLRIADTDGNGQLDYQEFVKVIMAKSADLDKSAQNEVGSGLAGFSFVNEISSQSWEFVEQLCQQVYAHPALNHPYLKGLATGELADIEGSLKDYAIQYDPYSNNFKSYLELAISQLEKPEHQQLIRENYKEENGQIEAHHKQNLATLGIEFEWVDNIPHTILFSQLQTALGVTDADLERLCPEAQRFHQQIHAICSKDAASAIGAIGLAGELGVKQIYSYILEAIQRYTPLVPRDYVFLALHTQVDDGHGQALKAIAADLAGNATHREKLREGMEAALTARCEFWDALLERALTMPENPNSLVSPAQLYEANSQKWVRREPSCLSDFTARPAIFELCEPVKDAVVLDLGCGEGYCSRELMKRGARQVIGVDISANLIAAAQAEEAHQPLGIRYLQGNSTSILEVLQADGLVAGGDEQFDLIVAVFLFNYLTFHEMLQCMTQVQQLLKPGGRFVFAVPHPSFAFLSQSKTTFHFNIQNNTQNNGGSWGYFSDRDRLLSGEIARRDGTRLPVQVRHKTMQDYFNALQRSGFTALPTVQELTVSQEQIQQDRAFFGSLQDMPLHIAFNIQKQVLLPAKQPDKQGKAIIQDIVWSRMFNEEDYCFRLPETVLDEFRQVYPQLQALNITWENYEVSDAVELPHLQAFAHEMRDCCYETTGFVLIQGFPLEEFGDSYEAREAAAKLFYYMMSLEIGLVSERRGRLYDVRDRGLNVADDNVLFSVTKEASGWHTDSTDKDFSPDIVGLFCLQDGAEGGVLQVTNAINVYYRLKQTLPQSIFEELERPIVRDLIEKGLGEKSGDLWEQLRRSSALKAQQYRLRNNRFPIFSRNPYTHEFSCRYMRYWIESGHQKSGVPLSLLLTIAMNALDDAMANDPTVYRIERQLKPGEIIYTNNHICLHNRTTYEEKNNQPKRHMVRVWIDLNPTV
jgi:toxoflavin synthase